MDSSLANLLQDAFSRYLSMRGSETLVPNDALLAYDKTFAEPYVWQGFGETIVAYERTELTNLIHRWRSALRSWHAWNLILSTHSREHAWEIRREFAEPTIHLCLLQPSAIRDAISLMDEFSDCIAAYIAEGFDGDITVQSISPTAGDGA